jgi:hypothetical protein
MDLKTYLLQMPVPQREVFAKRCGTTYGHMRNVAYGEKSCAEILALNIERESGGAVSLDSLRSDLKAKLDASGYTRSAQPAAQASPEAA